MSRRMADELLSALGQRDNIVSLLPCSTRLRVEVVNPALVDEDLLRSAGALAVLRANQVVQVVLGPEADSIALDMGYLS